MSSWCSVLQNIVIDDEKTAKSLLELEQNTHKFEFIRKIQKLNTSVKCTFEFKCIFCKTKFKVFTEYLVANSIISSHHNLNDACDIILMDKALK